MIRNHNKPIVLFLTSYPSRPCGIATFSKDLITAIEKKFGSNYELKVCALESTNDYHYDYPEEVVYRLNTHNPLDIIQKGNIINSDPRIAFICLQHEFGLWGGHHGDLIMDLLPLIKKPIVTVFHTVLPQPGELRKSIVTNIEKHSDWLLVMTKSSADILKNTYCIKSDKIQVIPHGTHHISWGGQNRLKEKYGYSDNLVLSTFGLLGPNKSIETTILALPELVKAQPTLKFLILGQTHPEILRYEGEKYTKYLKQLVDGLGLTNHVEFVHKYLSLKELLEYLKLTDIYIFSSKDPNQAVSGTFSYAMSCGCPILSTPIPHALEELDKKSGRFFNFEDVTGLSKALIPLLKSKKMRKDMALHAYQKTRGARWENVAILYNDIFTQLIRPESIMYEKPPVKIDQMLKLTDHFGMIQFSKITKPDKTTGYTIDDNARALIAMIMYSKYSNSHEAFSYIATYLDFIEFCQSPDGTFQNYVDIGKQFHKLNNYVNLEDSNGRAVWALGFVIANSEYLPDDIVSKAQQCLINTSPWLSDTKSPRAIAFIVKGLHYYYQCYPSKEMKELIMQLADKLIARYVATAGDSWIWFEDYLTYANSVLSEALILAYDLTRKSLYRNIALNTFNFLLSHLFTNGHLRVISNRGWLHRDNKKPEHHGEQPIDVTYTIQTLDTFYKILGIDRHKYLAETAFSWFLGNNQLRQVMYDPLTGGCYDGLEETGVNLNQGAESTVCYLMARLIVDDKYEYAQKTPSVRKSQSDKSVQY